MPDSSKADESVIARIAKALGVVSGEKPVDATQPADAAQEAPETASTNPDQSEDVAKAEAAADAPTAESEGAADATVEGVEKAVEQTMDTDHAPMTGSHSHEHVSHMAVVTHGHDHSHDNDSYHGHSHVAKAEDLAPLFGELITAEVAKAVEAVKAESAEAIAKAQVNDEHIVELINTALEPIAKAFEDFAVAFARQPITPNVTARIEPKDAGAPVDPSAVNNMDMGSALRYLLHGSR